MYKTDSFARIRCAKCNEIIDALTPGKEFLDIKKCTKCEVKENVALRTTTRTTKKSESK